MRKDAWTHEKFWQRFNELPDKNLYEVISLPEKMTHVSKFKIKCQNGHEFEKSMNNFFGPQKQRCPICNNKEHWSVERFLRQIDLISDKDDYIFSNYENINYVTSRFTVTCKKCYCTWDVSVGNFFHKQSRCDACNSGERWSKERVLKEIDNLIDKDDYIFGNYDNVLNDRSKISVTCKRCGSNWKPRVNNFFIQKQRCMTCKSGERWTDDRLIREFIELNDSQDFHLVITNKIQDYRDIFYVVCDKGHSWATTPHRYFGSKSRCPICKGSKGEREISFFLEFNNIIYVRQKKFDNCRSQLPLPFDFYLPDYNLLIEFQGEQHFKPTAFNKKIKHEITLQKFEDVKTRDAIKKKWAIDNNYKFIEISYREINQIEEILTQELCI